MKVGILRCMQTEDFCPGTTDFRMIQQKQGAFHGVNEDIGNHRFYKLRRMSWKKAVLRARELVKRGADTIAFASCIQKGTPIGYPCPFGKKMRELIVQDLGDSIRILVTPTEKSIGKGRKSPMYFRYGDKETGYLKERPETGRAHRPDWACPASGRPGSVFLRRPSYHRATNLHQSSANHLAADE